MNAIENIMEQGIRNVANLCQVMVQVDQEMTQETFDRLSQALVILQRAIGKV